MYFFSAYLPPKGKKKSSLKLLIFEFATLFSHFLCIIFHLTFCFVLFIFYSEKTLLTSLTLEFKSCASDLQLIYVMKHVIFPEQKAAKRTLLYQLAFNNSPQDNSHMFPSYSFLPLLHFSRRKPSTIFFFHLRYLEALCILFPTKDLPIRICHNGSL